MTLPHMIRPSWLTPGVVLMLASSFFFGLMNVGAKLLSRIPVSEIALVRSLVIISLTYALIRRAHLSPWGNNKRFLVLRGAAGTVALLLYLWTVQVMPLSSAVTIQYLSPIFTVMMGVLLLGERTAPRQWLLFAVAFAGVLMIKGFDTRVTGWELAAGVCSALASGLAYSTIRRLKDDDDPLVVVFYFPLLTIPIVTPVVAVSWVMPTMSELAILVFVGITTTAAQICMTRAYQLERVDRISMLTYVGTIYAIGFGYLLFDEGLTWLGGLGIALIIAGVALGTRGWPARRGLAGARTVA